MKKTEVWATRLTAVESAVADQQRGALTRAEWLRWLILQQKKST